MLRLLAVFVFSALLVVPVGIAHSSNAGCSQGVGLGNGTRVTCEADSTTSTPGTSGGDDGGGESGPVVCRFDGNGSLLPGMFGRIVIRYDSRADALVVPRAALLEDGGEPAAYAVRDGKATRVALQLGYADGAWTVMLSRKLNTGNDDDVAFDPRKKYNFKYIDLF